MAPKGWTTKLIDADESMSAYKGDYFVAIHADGSTAGSVNGASVGYQNSQGHALATRWKSAYKEVGWTRAWKRDNYTVNLARYYGVRNAISVGNTNAIIIEAGFMSNPGDRAWIDANHEAIAKSIWMAVKPDFSTGGSKPVTSNLPSMYMFYADTAARVDTLRKAADAAGITLASRGSHYLGYVETSAQMDVSNKMARHGIIVVSKPWYDVKTRQERMISMSRNINTGMTSAASMSNELTKIKAMNL